ncbi:hypothetical protein [Streptomyces sp. NPDC058678]|uniref:hypothetical protein n=1 Tax=Streptomyces sp. NPDC058678 TaxID=3346595 RepID=UPI003657A365
MDGLDEALVRFAMEGGQRAQLLQDLLDAELAEAGDRQQILGKRRPSGVTDYIRRFDDDGRLQYT